MAGTRGPPDRRSCRMGPPLEGLGEPCGVGEGLGLVRRPGRLPAGVEPARLRCVCPERRSRLVLPRTRRGITRLMALLWGRARAVEAAARRPIAVYRPTGGLPALVAPLGRPRSGLVRALPGTASRWPAAGSRRATVEAAVGCAVEAAVGCAVEAAVGCAVEAAVGSA